MMRLSGFGVGVLPGSFSPWLRLRFIQMSCELAAHGFDQKGKWLEMVLSKSSVEKYCDWKGGSICFEYSCCHVMTQKLSKS